MIPIQNGIYYYHRSCLTTVRGIEFFYALHHRFDEMSDLLIALVKVQIRFQMQASGVGSAAYCVFLEIS